MLKKIFNFNKKDQFFLELDENEDVDIAATAKAIATKVTKETKQIAQDVKETVADSQLVEKITSETKELTQKAETQAEQAVSQAKEKAQAQVKKVESQVPTNSSAKSETTAKDSQSESVEQKTNAQPVQIDTSYSDEPFWVKLMYKSSEQKEAEIKSEKTFATDYLISKPKPRRRPGGSIDKYKKMVK